MPISDLRPTSDPSTAPSDVKRILLIDDDEAIRLSVAFLLESNGFAVVTATNGREGLRRCDERSPDLVITDVMMPDMDGIETITALRRA